MTVGSQSFGYQKLSLNGRHGCRLMFRISRGWSDTDVFKKWTFGKLVGSDKLNIPDPRVLPGDAEGLSMRFVLVGNEAFALPEHALGPY